MSKDNRFRAKRKEIENAVKVHAELKKVEAEARAVLTKAETESKAAWGTVAMLAEEYANMVGAKSRDGEEGQEAYGWSSPPRYVRTRLADTGFRAEHVVGKRHSERIGSRGNCDHPVIRFKRFHRKFRLTKGGEIAKNFDGEQIRPDVVIIPIPE